MDNLPTELKEIIDDYVSAKFKLGNIVYDSWYMEMGDIGYSYYKVVKITKKFVTLQELPHWYEMIDYTGPFWKENDTIIRKKIRVGRDGNEGIRGFVSNWLSSKNVVTNHWACNYSKEKEIKDKNYLKKIISSRKS